MPCFLVRAVTVFLFLAAYASADDETGFTPLFDGKTLAGWEGDEKVFRVENGAIMAGSLQEKVAHNEFLASKEEFRDFELRLKARLVGKGENAGVQFRSQRIENHFEMIGYQCDMGTMQGRSIWGTLYDESRRRKFLAEPDAEKLKAVLKPEEWNDVVIRCEGPRIQIWVNGLQTVDYTEADASVPLRGRLGLQIHGGEPAEAAYKDIRIKRLGGSDC
jgi:3-keto-disaccharide hydrolase